MRVLAIDTATEACSVGLFCDDTMSGESREVGRGHADQILGMVDATLAQAGLTLADLDGLAASVGPGSFTGVRISVSVGQGLAFGAGLNVVPVTTLEALALQAVGCGAEQVLCCLDARMGEVYWACYRADAAQGVVPCGVMAVGPADSVHVPFAGSFAGIGRGFTAHPTLRSLPGLVLAPDAGNALPDARDMARLGALRLRAGGGLDPADLAPQYLRNKVALTEVERRAVTELSQTRIVIVG